MEVLIVGLVIIGIILITSIIIVIYCIILKDWFDMTMGSIYAIVSGIFVVSIIYELKNFQPEPTAIDVYRGLTELEITSVNGTPQDTIVVFKK